MIALIILPFYIVANYYVCRWFMKWLDALCKGRLHKAVKVVIHIVYWLLCLAMYIAALVPNGQLRRVLNVAGTFWYGVVIYILFFFLVTDLIRIIIRKKKKIPKGQFTITRKQFMALGSVILVIIATLSIYGTINARTLHDTNYEITVDKEAGDIDTLNVALVADMHMGYSVGVDMIEDMVNRINAQNPDIVLLAGDIFDNNYDALQDPDRLLELYKSINSKYGVYAVYGNHDVDEMIIGGFTFKSDKKKVADERMDQFLEDAGIVNLRDEGVMIDNAFYLYGRPDAERLGRGIEVRKTPDEITEGIDKNIPIIIMDHEPRQLGELSEAGIDVDLSGHTHDGQIFPLNLIGHIVWENPCGVYKKGNMYSVTTSGVGFYGPGIRVGTSAEVVNLKIHFNKSSN